MASNIRDNVITRALSRMSLRCMDFFNCEQDQDDSETAFCERLDKPIIVTNRIHVVTWNVNGKAPPDDMDSLFIMDEHPLPEIYAIGLQEVSGESWETAFIILFHRHNFVRIKMRKLQGIHTFLFVHRSVLPFVSNVESEVTRTGFGGYWGNKGASTVRMDFKGVNIAVVNCHLAAHRDEDVDTILESQRFKDVDSDNILDHDYVLWMGDMNFRLDNVSREDAIEQIEAKQFHNLLEHDQLKLVKMEKLLFDGFHEPPINFPPTYKFDIGSNEYDTSEKQRVPAYTDRILYLYHDTAYGALKLDVDCLSYRSHPSYMISDHRPVTATIAISVPEKPIHGPITFDIQVGRRSREMARKFRYKIRKDFVT
ncbi:hypothetical protein EGW08_020043, partial [Elysia chlorotica]